MYSGTTLTKASGRLLGAHQKIDRLSWHGLQNVLPEGVHFPGLKAILHFEGANGPDAIKRKSPARDEPWHYYDPFSSLEQDILLDIDEHYNALVGALQAEDAVRAAFEAAWLAHALVDGLTPAHHFPYTERLTEIRGESHHTRTTLRRKIVMPGATTSERLRNNWLMWGPGGLLSSHGGFELGVSMLMAPLSAKQTQVPLAELARLQEVGPLQYFQAAAREIAAYGMFDMYNRRGWSPRLTRLIRRQLVPRLVNTVTAVWYAAALDAQMTMEQEKIL